MADLMSGSAAEKEALDFQQLKASYQSIVASQEARPTVAQVRTIVRSLARGDSLARTSSFLKRAPAGHGEEFVLDVLTALGTWLTHSQGNMHAHIVFKDLPETAVGGGKCLLKHCDPTKPIHTVIVPRGYKSGAGAKRNIDRALSSVLCHTPDDDVIGRFVARTYATRTATLNYQVVAGVWGFASRGRLSSIDRVSDDTVFLSQAIEAYELLNVARIDGTSAVAGLIGGEYTSLDEIAGAAEVARWVSEADMERVLRSVAAARLRGEAGALLVKTDLARLDKLSQREPRTFFPASVGELSLAHVRRICSVSGIEADPSDKAAERGIRAQLKDMGLQADADILLPEAVRASGSGQIDRFWDILRGRLQGDDTWMAQLEDLSA